MSSRGDEDHDQPGSYRDGITPAQPEPVTDAMINPRTKPGGGNQADGPICHVCGSSNRPAASYCLQCGSHLRDDSAPPGADVIGEMADDGFWDPDLDDAVWERSPASAPQAGSLPTTPERPPVPVGGLVDRRDTVRLVLWAMLGLAALILILITFIRRSGDGDVVPTTTPDAGLDTQVYGALISDLAADVDGLITRATLINERWDARESDFQETLAGLETLASDVAEVGARLRLEDAPPGVSPETHARLVASAGTLERAARDMVEGLKSPDTGEQRRAAFTRFLAAAAEFRAVADTLIQLVTVTSADE